MPFQLPELPFSMDALAPRLSKETLEYHYGKHHANYVNTLNKLLVGSPLEAAPLEEIIRKTEGPVFNNAAQVWNHTFYWNCLSPKGGKDPSGSLVAAINKDFGSVKQFKEKFTAAATSLFGSGWTWLVKGSNGALSIEQTGNAMTPIVNGHKPLLTCDVWEHAYYIDYRNNRAKYLENFWEMVNWDFVQKNLG